jgi:hypothetical protein
MPGFAGSTWLCPLRVITVMLAISSSLPVCIRAL